MTACQFSPCRRYRYTLWRDTGILGMPPKMLQFIGLNPSTADDTVNDATIRRCIEFAARWGYGTMLMTNLFAFRATNPASMKEQDDPIGPDNDYYIAMNARKADRIVLAWGTHGIFRHRNRKVTELLKFLECGHKLRVFGFSKGGHPIHPLYQKRSVELQSYYPVGDPNGDAPS